MKEYRLADSGFRKEIDLRRFEKEIKKAVHKHCPNAKVVVKSDHYEIDIDITKGDAIRIGRQLAAGVLGKYCLQRATLFIGQTK